MLLENQLKAECLRDMKWLFLKNRWFDMMEKLLFACSFYKNLVDIELYEVKWNNVLLYNRQAKLINIPKHK